MEMFLYVFLLIKEYAILMFKLLKMVEKSLLNGIYFF